jgi:hypothetical protein
MFYRHANMGPLLLGGGGTVWFDRTGKLNINIFPQNCWRAGWGEVTKNFFRTYQKKFSGHIRKFPLTSRNFRKNTKKFSGHIKIFPKFLCFARILHCFLPDRKIFGGARAPPCPPAHTPMIQRT